MMNKIEKLLDLCIAIAEAHLEAKEKETHPMLPFPAASTEPIKGEERNEAIEAPVKKTRKPRTPKEEAPTETPAADPLEDQLSGVIEETKAPEMTEEQSAAKMEEVTKQFVSLCKNDKPEDGKTRAIRLMRETFKVAKLGELTHKQRIEWIAEMEKGILEHK